MIDDTAMRYLAALLASLVLTPLYAQIQSIELTSEQIARYNNVLFQASVSPPLPLALLAAQNASTAHDDEALRDRDSTIDRILTGGVPLRSFDSLLAAQLFAPQRFVADQRASLSVRLVVRDYRTQYQRVNTVNMSPKIANAQAFIARRMQDINAPVAHLQLQVIVSDVRNAQQDVWDIRAHMADCERLAGAQWLAARTPDEAFWQTYSRTAIGQTVQAGINYAVEQIYLRYSASLIRGEIIARRGERLQLSLALPDVNVGDTVALWHRSDPARVIGHLRIKELVGSSSYAYPIDVHPAAVTLGDAIYTSRPPAAPTLFLPPPPRVSANASQCDRDKIDKADDNETTTSD